MLSHILILGHMGFHQWGNVMMSVSLLEVIKFKTPLPPYCRLHDDSQMFHSAHPPLHMQASPQGREKRHLLPIPPAAAGNNQRDTKSQAAQRAKRLFPKEWETLNTSILCVHIYLCCLSNWWAPSNLYPLRCFKTGSVSYWSFKMQGFI